MRKLGKLRSSDGGCLDFDGKYVKTLRDMTHGFLLNIVKLKTKIPLIFQSYWGCLNKYSESITNSKESPKIENLVPVQKGVTIKLITLHFVSYLCSDNVLFSPLLTGL